MSLVHQHTSPHSTVRAGVDRFDDHVSARSIEAQEQTKTCFAATMVDGNVVAYNVAVFVSTLFLLEFGADKFVDHTAVVARRTGVSDTVIALLTAGAEWEEVSKPGPLVFLSLEIANHDLSNITASCRCRVSCAGTAVTGSGQHHRVCYLQHPGRLFAWAPVPSKRTADPLRQELPNLFCILTHRHHLYHARRLLFPQGHLAGLWCHLDRAFHRIFGLNRLGN